ncbi:MAG: hypothetical protein JJU28_09920 [Cyclobacteriaceae bacterium]|nr:hypothetical protein [Cyclobacteriaceae bacterium]
MHYTFFFRFILLCIAYIFITACNRQESDLGFLYIQKNFQNPPSPYRPAPFWVWNDEITHEKIRQQLIEFKDAGMGGVFIHPRMGMITEYLSDEWYELYKYSLEICDSLDMLLYLYDENAFPSGFAGGHVPAEYPEAYNQGNGLQMHVLEKLPLSTGSDFALILRYENENFENITDTWEKYLPLAGTYYAFSTTYFQTGDPWFGGYTYADLLLEGMTEKFIDITFKGYNQHLSHAYGKRIPAVFSDETRVRPTELNSVRWTPGLFEMFEKRWGYDLRNHLPSLLLEIGADWEKVRHNYYTLIGDLLIDRWAKPYYHYAESIGLDWTGHYYEHDWPSPKNGGDWAALAAWQHIPGIDLLFNHYAEDEISGWLSQFGSHRAVRELSSVANQMGRKRSISETYGAAGWQFNFKDMKRIADWQYALGVNFLNQHHSFMTIKGARKRDYPPSFSYHSSWWPYYRVFGDYYGRLSLALSTGQQINDVLVLAPTSSAWMYYSPVENAPGYMEVGLSFQKFTLELELARLEYDIASERNLQEFAKVNDKGQLVFGHRIYRELILPPDIRTIESTTFMLIKELLQKGKTIHYAGSIPDRIDGTPDQSLVELFENTKSQWKKIEDYDVSNFVSKQSLQFTESSPKKARAFHRRMQLDDGEILFIANINDSLSFQSTLVAEGNEVIYLDPMQGKIYSYPAKMQNGKLIFDIDLEPVESALFFISRRALSDLHEKPQKKNPLREKRMDKLVIQREQPNTLTLDYADFEIADKKWKGLYLLHGVDSAFRMHGFAHGNPWHRAVQYKQRIIERDTFTTGTGYKVTFDIITESLNNEALSNVKAVIERGNLWAVKINGKEVLPEAGEWWLDRDFEVFNIGPYMKNGNNRLEVAINPMSVHAELEPVYILGDFSLQNEEKGWKLTPAAALKTGDWTTQGMPMYSGEVSYSTTWQLSAEEKEKMDVCFVQLNDWQGILATVKVNDADAGIIGWPPYNIEINKYLKSGENSITITVFGSLKNMMGPHHDGPENRMAIPSMFTSAPRKHPQGRDYHVLSYGLMEPFSLRY